MNFTVPIILIFVCVGLATLIFWGGFSEERRLSRKP